MALKDLRLEVEELFGAKAEILADLSFSNRALVARVLVDGHDPVVAKRPHTKVAFDNEVAALRTLPPSTRPELVVVGEHTIVMEDLGSGPSLADLLLGESARAAEAGLLSWATTLGAALAPTLKDGADEKPESLEAGLSHMLDLARDLEVEVPSGVGAETARIADILAAPGPWLAFCPSDTCPDNNRVFADGSIRLFDFEGAGWRHAAMEAAYCRAPFSTCWCVAGLPAGLTDEMEAAFLESLNPSRLAEFRDTIGVATVGYTLATFDWFSRFITDDLPVGPPQKGPVSGRQYVYARLEMVARNRDRLPALAALAGRMATAFLGRWPNAAPMPLYPAFR